ncbi:FecR protein [Pedobacter steynii]|uniref:FecR protein n=1 Tax=Pedobacter steynii TaxID=430522 RepID=A0A1G9UCM8_9SPHI|nr:FecR family protein [Pedobacter steynii]NQX40732.1 FecR domain-containing protein [Pedobacter steynii]SDM57727.1 FecR protein [Pedobacter steynii]
MSETELSKLIEKYKNGTLTEEESAFLNAWYIKYAVEQESSFDPAYLDQNLDLMWNAIEDNVAQHGFRTERLKPVAKTSLWPRIAAAASVIMVMGAALYFFNTDKTKTPTAINIAKTEIRPGGNRAFLTLADGSKISLNDAANGQLANQAGITITKTKNGQLIYTIADQQSAKPGNLYNTIETPRGGQYQINLPDGSKVWLNAETKLKFPVTFANKKERKVELRGEAYFEVAKLKTEGIKMPFIVASTGQEVEVLGTHFNVNAYPDEQDTKTTLLEGLVRVSGLLRPRNAILKPGQQSSLSPTGLSLKNVDTEQAVAWKNGQFMFSNEPLTQVMKEVSRWYNVEVEYKGDFSNVVIGGSVSKFTNIKEVLDVLALAGKINFKTVGNKVIVSP